MHGKGLSFAARPLRAEQGLSDRRPPGELQGFRHLLGPETIPKGVNNPKKSLKELQHLMAGLARRVELGVDWSKKSIESWENPGLPSGYTYLLQLVAHDVVESALSLAESEKDRTAPVNYRLSPLRLDTIYGGGPDACPFAYASEENIEIFPRIRLRLGRIQVHGRVDESCPFRDIARADLTNANDRLSKPQLTEALIADPRNDDHAIISQLVTLFHLLHNGLLQSFRSPVTPNSLPPIEARYELFLGARSAVTLIYRNIVEKDLLPKLIDPEVYDLYTKQRPQLHPWDGRIPLEFSHGAFRCGHAMVRRENRINGEAPLTVSEALNQTSLRGPRDMPISDRWVIQWSRFFEVEGSKPDLSRRIGPDYSVPLLNNDPLKFPAIDESGKPGLAYRDLLSGALAQLWRVPDLIETIRRQPDFKSLGLMDWTYWKPELKQWLSEHREATGLSDSDIGALSDDPPLPFFILFEAATQNHGERLGTLGSIIVAEVLFGALRQPSPETTGKLQLTAGERVQTIKKLAGDPGIVDGIEQISTMPQLLTFMADNLGLRGARPAFL